MGKRRINWEGDFINIEEWMDPPGKRRRFSIRLLSLFLFLYLFIFFFWGGVLPPEGLRGGHRGISGTARPRSPASLHRCRRDLCSSSRQNSGSGADFFLQGAPRARKEINSPKFLAAWMSGRAKTPKIGLTSPRGCAELNPGTRQQRIPMGHGEEWVHASWGDRAAGFGFSHGKGAAEEEIPPG